MLPILLWLLSLSTLSSALLVLPPSQQQDDLDSVAKTIRRGLFDSQQRVFGGSVHNNEEESKQPKLKVPVVLGVMSKCPDAELCESVFDKTLASVNSIVDLKTVYIGQLNESMTPYGVWCKHGPSECDGNVQQLCVRDGSTSQKDWWNFIQCQNFENLNRVGDLSLAKRCAKVINKDWDQDFSSCYTGKRGRRLLRESVLDAQRMNITKSCSIVINDRLVCVHDGSWKDCPNGHEAGDFARLIKEEYDAIN